VSRGFVVRAAWSAALTAAGAGGCGDNYRTQDATVDVAVEPQDARFVTPVDTARRPDASPFDAPPGVPDLQFVASEMTKRIVEQHNFYPNDCEVIEGCVGAAGARLLLRFDTVTANLGTGDLVVGVTPPPGESNDTFQWSPCHMHHHYANYVAYQLIDSAGSVVTAHKQAFCLEDGEQVQVGTTPRGFSCLNQGISRGFADVYSRYTPCQWIDVTGMPSGDYTLRAEVNPLHTLPESSYDNNVFTVGVTL